VNEVLERYREQLLKIKGVTGVGSTGGKIIVYVEEITPEVRAFIPRTLEGVEVVVKRIGRVGILERTTGRWRPVPAGVSIGHPKVTAGTLGCWCRRKGEVVGLSNNHVIAVRWGEAMVGERGDPVLQPGVYDGGKMEDKIGELEAWEEVREDKVNTVDAAVFVPTEKIRREVLEIGVPVESVEPRAGMSVRKFGRTSELTFGKIEAVDVSIMVEGYGEVRFDRCFTVGQPFVYPGDSGSVVFSTDRNSPVGLAFAGSDVVGVACRADEVEKALGVEWVVGAGFPLVGYGLLLAPVAFFGGVLLGRGR